MKRIRLNLVMIAIVLGVAGTVATKAVATTHKISDPIYTWTHYDTDGTTVLSTGDQYTVSDAEAAYGCSSNATRCATGTATGQPNVTLKYDE